MPMMPGARVLGAKTPNRQTPAIVQQVHSQPATSSTLTLTFPLAPIVGNLMVAFTDYSQFGATRTISGPSGWTKILDFTGQGAGTNATNGDSYAMWIKVVDAIDAAGPLSYVWNISGSAENCSMINYELSGVDPISPINSCSYLPAASQVEVGGMRPVVYTNIYGCLVICTFHCDGGGTAGTSSTDWVQDQDCHGGSGFHEQSSYHKTTPTPAGFAQGPLLTGPTNNYTAFVMAAFTPATA